jgi:hypothetical protein
MIFRLLTIFFLLPISAADLSTALLNNQLHKNYTFIERSLSKTNLKIEESTGNILFDGSGLTVNVFTPFKEIYRLEGDKVEIHDLFLDQKQVIDLNQANNFFLNILLNGVEDGSTEYSLKYLNNSIEVVPVDGSPKLIFVFVETKLGLIRYTDSIGVEHGIELTGI